MRSKFLVETVAVLALAGLAACNQNTTADNRGNASNPPQTTASDTQPTARSDNAVVTRDQTPNETNSKPLEATAATKRYAEGAAMGDMLEVESSRVALERSKAPEIKKFAQDMIDAHTKTSDELKSKLVKAGLIVEVPTTLDAMHKAMLDDLKNASAADFDMRYIALQKKGHDEALMLHQSYGRNGDIADLKAFANDTAPKVQQHIMMLADLENKMQARTAQNR